MSQGVNYATIAGIVFLLVVLVALIGYPVLISIAVLASFAALALIIVLSAGDMLERPASRASESNAEPQKTLASAKA